MIVQKSLSEKKNSKEKIHRHVFAVYMLRPFYTCDFHCNFCRRQVAISNRACKPAAISMRFQCDLSRFVAASFEHARNLMQFDGDFSAKCVKNDVSAESPQVAWYLLRAMFFSSKHGHAECDVGRKQKVQTTLKKEPSMVL